MRNCKQPVKLATIWQNWCFVQFAQLLALVIFVSVSLLIENLRGLRENLKHKIRSLAVPDDKVDHFVDIVKQIWHKFHPDLKKLSEITFEKYESPNFLGYFVGKEEEILLRLKKFVEPLFWYTLGLLAVSVRSSVTHLCITKSIPSP